MGQVTLESESIIRRATKLLYLVTDSVTKDWLHQLNDSAEDLYSYYHDGEPRYKTYEEIVECILSYVRSGELVCVAFYGHPGVFVYPGYAAIAHARRDGFHATMLPGVSAEDCLFADLGLDPGTSGCQSFEATDFLVYSRIWDPDVPLILWQISCVGQLTHEQETSKEGLEALVEYLSKTYDGNHEVIVYEAARYPVCPPVVHRGPLEKLVDAPVSGISTLVVPPRSESYANPAMVSRLKIPEMYIVRKSRLASAKALED